MKKREPSAVRKFASIKEREYLISIAARVFYLTDAVFENDYDMEKCATLVADVCLSLMDAGPERVGVWMHDYAELKMPDRDLVANVLPKPDWRAGDPEAA
jgi:hypothetical protein